MNYELAKELKEAGFPQNYNGHSYFCSKTKSVRSTNSDHPYLPADIAIPTLSELIEACAQPHFTLTLDALGAFWIAEIFQSDYECTGGKPEEAVAKLWLAINCR